MKVRYAKDNKAGKCDICGKRMWWWQDTTMTTDEFSHVIIQVNHIKCSKKMEGKVYRGYNEK